MHHGREKDESLRVDISGHTRLYRGTSLIRNSAPLGIYKRNMPRALWWPLGGLLMSEVSLYLGTKRRALKFEETTWREEMPLPNLTLSPSLSLSFSVSDLVSLKGASQMWAVPIHVRRAFPARTGVPHS